MSQSLVAYFDVSQADIDRFVKKNNLDTSSWDDGQKIVQYFKTQYLSACSYPFHLVYIYHQRMKKHVFFDAHPVAFVFKDLRLQRKNMRGRKVADVKSIFLVRTVKDAIIMAHDLRMYYDDDDSLMLFAGWLQATARYCLQYQIENF